MNAAQFEPFDAYLVAHQDQFLAELQQFCSQPSISATGEGLHEMAAMVQQKLHGLGATGQTLTIDSKTPPILYATGGQGARRLLIYNHYDVQPVDPLELWHSPPFKPTIREGKIYGRGVSDNKGHLLARIQAVRAWQESIGPLPCEITWFVEGAEEIGSIGLEPFCMANKDLLQADGCLWEMGQLDEAGLPTLMLGAKGLLYVELRLRTMSGDQHSAWGTIAPDAIWRLTWALNSLKAPDETLLIEGLNEHIRPPSPTELALLDNIEFAEQSQQATFGITEWVGGVTGKEALARHILQPTCTICGIEGGYTGEGMKTVLSATAKAKVSFRLVPDLTPELLLDLLRAHLNRHGFADVEIINLGGEHPGRSDPQSGVVQAAIAAVQDIFAGATPPIYPNSPGTGPVWPVAIAHGVPLVGFGMAHPGTNIHAPNENLRLSDYFQNIRLMGRFLAHFATM